MTTNEKSPLWNRDSADHLIADFADNPYMVGFGTVLKVRKVRWDGAPNLIHCDCENMISGISSEHDYVGIVPEPVSEEKALDHLRGIKEFGPLGFEISQLENMSSGEVEAMIQSVLYEPLIITSSDPQCSLVTDAGKDLLLSKYNIVFDKVKPMSYDEYIEYITKGYGG